MGLKSGGLRSSLRNVSQTSAIPDSEDLHAHYDATGLSLSDGDLVTTWSDETGNGYDLTDGGAPPTYQTSVINGNPVVRFDGVDDFLDVAFTVLSQPNNIYAVIQVTSFDTTNFQFLTDAEADSSSDRNAITQPSSDNWGLFAGNSIEGGSPDTNPHIFGGLYDGGNSVLRVDGSAVVSGDAGSGGLDGLTVGANQSGGGNIAIDVGEILVYPQDKSGVQSNIEAYLSDKWGIVI